MSKPALKISSGKYRGQRIRIPPPGDEKNAHFTTGLMKEAIFQILNNVIPAEKSEYAFFDLCAGSGQMALEALSNGFNPVYLNELDSRRFSFLLESMKEFRKELRFHNKDFRRFSRDILGERNSIVFIDPPYSFWIQKGCPHIDRFLENLIRIFNNAPAKNSSDEENQKLILSDDIRFNEILLLIQGPYPYNVNSDLLSRADSIIDFNAEEVRDYRKHYLSILRITPLTDR